MELAQLTVFARVAELGSFSRAAEQLSLAKGRVSIVVQQLEARLGVRLLQRTTRSVRLTPDGEQFLERCKDLLAEAEQLQAMFQGGAPQRAGAVASGLRGKLRIDLPNSLARDLIVPRLPEFLALHPLLEIGISSTDRRVDLIQEGFDCVLRVGVLGRESAELVARPLGLLPQSNVASPAYLRAHGRPKTLADLTRQEHRVIHYAPKLGTQGAGFEYLPKAQKLPQTRVQLQPLRCALVVNSADAYQSACLAGLGIIQAPVYGTRRLVQAGLLEEILPDFPPPALPVTLLYAHRRQLAPRVQAVLDWLAAVVAPHLAPHLAPRAGA